jgi:hypothetical protein
MRSAPALHFSVNHHGVWRAGLLLLAACASGSMLAWWWVQPEPLPWANATAGVGVLLSMACLAGLWRDQPLTLRFDRHGWFLARAGSPECAGGLSVAVDLGSWMLLRFMPQSSGAGANRIGRPVWIALQRRGLESQWHAVRCGLFASRPAAPSPAAPGHG